MRITSGHAGLIPLVVLLLAMTAACARGTLRAPGQRRAREDELGFVGRPGFIKAAAVHRYRLTCDPSGGSLPSPDTACQNLQASPTLLTHKRICATPDVGSAEVSGLFVGARVDAGFGMCGTDQQAWDALARAVEIPTS